MTAGPCIVGDAKILPVVSYNDIANLIHQGAKVIHPRAVEIAMQRNVSLMVRSTFSDGPGTLVTNSVCLIRRGVRYGGRPHYYRDYLHAEGDWWKRNI